MNTSFLSPPPKGLYLEQATHSKGQGQRQRQRRGQGQRHAKDKKRQKEERNPSHHKWATGREVGEGVCVVGCLCGEIGLFVPKGRSQRAEVHALLHKRVLERLDVFLPCKTKQQNVMALAMPLSHVVAAEHQTHTAHRHRPVHPNGQRASSKSPGTSHIVVIGAA